MKSKLLGLFQFDSSWIPLSSLTTLLPISYFSTSWLPVLQLFMVQICWHYLNVSYSSTFFFTISVAFNTLCLTLLCLWTPTHLSRPTPELFEEDKSFKKKDNSSIWKSLTTSIYEGWGIAQLSASKSFAFWGTSTNFPFAITHTRRVKRPFAIKKNILCTDKLGYLQCIVSWKKL